MNKPTRVGCAAGVAILMGCAGQDDRAAEHPRQQSAAAVRAGPAVESSSASVGAEAGAVPTPNPASLVGVRWLWSRFTDPVAGALEVQNPKDYSLVFTEEGTVVVHSDCNTGVGVYTFDGDDVTVRVTKITSDTCGEDSLSTEFVDNLNSSSRYFMQGGSLFIDLRYDSGTMKFDNGGSARPVD